MLAVAVIWGSSYLAAKEVVEPGGVFAFLVVRFGLAATVLAVMVAPRIRGITRQELELGLLAGAVLSAVFALETFGVSRTSASNAGLIISLTVIMTPMLAQFVWRTALPGAFYAAAGVAVVGVVLLTQAGGLTAPCLGDLLIVAAAAARAVHVTVIARLSANRTLDSSRVTLVQLGVGLSVFGVASRFTGTAVGEVVAQWNVRCWLLTGYLAVVGTVFAFVIQTWALRRTSPTRVSLLLGTEPLWAAAVGVLLGGDPLTAIGAGGAVLVLLGTNWGRALEARIGCRPINRLPATSARQ
ncbi:DMT family transporter [Mycolicibacterium sp. CBM1]